MKAMIDQIRKHRGKIYIAALGKDDIVYVEVSKAAIERTFGREGRSLEGQFQIIKDGGALFIDSAS
jgi:hypothetical protein